MTNRALQSLLALLLSISICTAQSVVEKSIYYKSDQHTIASNNALHLQDVIATLAAYNEYSIKIIGHADQDGSSDYNLALSQKRAEAVRDFLIANGVAAKNITLDFLGENDLADSLPDENSKRQNRRVTIQAEGYQYDNLQELVSQLENNNDDTHTIDQDVATSLSLSKGTEVNIPASAFCHLDGSPLENGQVDLVFKEAFEYTSMIDESLFTQTADRWLETGGMIHIEASQNGQPIRLQDGSEIELLFPSQVEKAGMELFLGTQEEDGTIWQSTGEEITSVSNEKETPYIEVDLSPVLDFVFDNTDTFDITFAKMPLYPHPVRKANVPYKGYYSEEGYKDAYAKYEEQMAKYELDKVDRPQKLADWLEEAKLRKRYLFEHKKNYVRSQIVANSKIAIKRLNNGQDKVSHDRLMGMVFSYMDEHVGRDDYAEQHYIDKMFGVEARHVRDHLGLDFPHYHQINSDRIVPKFAMAIKKVERNISARMYELGGIDENVMGKYLVTTSDLGWINCDRFYDYPKEELMELAFSGIDNIGQYYLVFKDMKSLIRPKRKNGSIVFSGVPKGEDVRLIALDVHDQNAYLATQDLTLGSETKVNLNIAAAELKDLKRALEI